MDSQKNKQLPVSKPKRCFLSDLKNKGTVAFVLFIILISVIIVTIVITVIVMGMFSRSTQQQPPPKKKAKEEVASESVDDLMRDLEELNDSVAEENKERIIKELGSIKFEDEVPEGVEQSTIEEVQDSSTDEV